MGGTIIESRRATLEMFFGNLFFLRGKYCRISQIFVLRQMLTRGSKDAVNRPRALDAQICTFSRACGASNSFWSLHLRVFQELSKRSKCPLCMVPRVLEAPQGPPRNSPSSLRLSSSPSKRLSGPPSPASELSQGLFRAP